LLFLKFYNYTISFRRG